MIFKEHNMESLFLGTFSSVLEKILGKLSIMILVSTFIIMDWIIHKFICNQMISTEI